MPTETSKLELMKEVAVNNLNSIPAAKSGDSRAFIEMAVSWIGKWWNLRPGWTNIAPGYCALVLDHKFADNGVPSGFSEIGLFRDAPGSNLGGHVHVSDFSLNRVFRDTGGHTDAGSLCSRLRSLKLESAPCVVFDPQTGLLLAAERGLSGPIMRSQLSSFDGSLTVTNIDELITGLYNSALKFPETFPHVWWKKEGFVPIFQAEKLYQGILYIHLKGNTQGTCVVVREDQTNAGRTDITLTSFNPEVVFVIEMKVLKSFFYHALGKPVRPFKNADNEDWAKSGITQVCDYRTAKQATEAFLLLFDMRKKHTLMNKVGALCRQRSVLLRKYDIYNETARDIRAKPRRSKTR